MASFPFGTSRSRIGLQQQSGRVISLGRLFLSSLFLLAIWLDTSQPAQAAAETYSLLIAYVVLALAIAGATWSNWWLDARLAGPVHIMDVAVFTLLIFSTEGYTSPFFLFFVFLLLSSAIRWGWRETAITAAAVVILYLVAGLVVASIDPQSFELQRFIIRSGHLVILSAILIWFGINQGASGSPAKPEQLAPVSPDEPPLERALVAAVERAGAARGSLLWREVPPGKCVALSIRHGEMEIVPTADLSTERDSGEGPFLYDLPKNRAVARGPSRKILFRRARDWIDSKSAETLGLREGLAIPLGADTGTGEIFLEEIDSLSLDHIDLGRHLSREIADYVRRHALLRAVEERGEARARLALARDLHDSVVQFLAGAAFRIEAMMRRARSDGRADPELQELKRLMLQEQDDLRSFIGALRSGREIDLPQLSDELDSLAEKLARQWDIDCAFCGDVPQRRIPMRLHLDALQLVREAVANAVRHGRASAMRVFLTVEDDSLCLELQDNGSGFPAPMMLSSGLDDLHPRSLNERVQDAGGELMVAALGRGTSISITLPIKATQ